MDPLSLTAQYSATVLVAVLPHISQFAQQMELPVSLPITTNQVSRYQVMPGRTVECGIVLTNGMRFNFLHGHVSFFSSPRSYVLTPPSPRLTNFFGSVNLSQDEAIQLARVRIGRLGYSLKQTFTDQPPDVEKPPQIETNTIPYYVIRWRNPWDAWAGQDRYSIEIEVDGSSKSVTYLACTTRSLFRDLPDLKFKPPQDDSQLNPAFVAAMLRNVLPAASEFAQKLDLPFALPLATNMVAHFDYEPQQKITRLTMTNGYLIYFNAGFVSAFVAPDHFFPIHTFPPDEPRGDIADYTGEWRLTQTEAIDVARRTLTKLGHALDEFSADGLPLVTTTKQVGKYIVPRYRFEWFDNSSSGFVGAEVVVEVDAERGRIKSFSWFNRSLSRSEPNLDVEPFLDAINRDRPAPRGLGPYDPAATSQMPQGRPIFRTNVTPVHQPPVKPALREDK